MQPSRNFDDLKFSSIHRRILLWGSGGPFLDGYVLVMIGVALANPDRKVLCFSGDGSLMMNIQEM
ncbi:thiamine pyrophosphate-dependent enzyme, partial [Escherichia coli]